MNFRKLMLAGAAACMLHTSIAVAKDGDAPTGGRKLLDPANIDKSVKPGDNFFQYANGAWMKKTPIPESETRWGSFSELQENNYNALRSLLEEAAKNKTAEKGSPAQLVGTFYRNGMAADAIDNAGITPLKSHFARIDAISSPMEIIREVALEHTEGIGQLFQFDVSPDAKQVTKQIPQFYQGGLGMPDRDYYFNTDERTKKIQEAYRNYLSRMLAIIGYQEDNKAMTDGIYRLETALAEASMTRVEVRDPYKMYNKYGMGDMAKRRAEGMDWPMLFVTLRLTGTDSLIIAQPKFFEAVGEQTKRTPLPVWKAYLKFHFANEMAPYLSKDIDDLSFDFYGKTIRGQQQQKPRWKRVLQVVDGSIGELLGKMYVDKNFKPEAKARMLALVQNLQSTYADRIKKLTWMSAPTKQKALGKLNAFVNKIGYPDKWRNYSNLQLQEGDYAQNVLAAARFDYQYNINKLGKPVDKTEWGMTPPTVNAYYNPSFNEIVFPAGILQYPFFEMSADDAVNYGGIGGVIGHEMTHGFDDEGRQFAADGNLNDWWAPSDAKNFEAKAQKVVKQFNSYTILDTMHVNGELTLGENLADLGGMSIAYEAFKKTEQGKSGKEIDGFTPDQRFFLSWAQVWRANIRPEEAANRIIVDPHAPGEWRVNGPVVNIDAWYTAFGVKPGDKMYIAPKDRTQIW